MLWRLFVPSPQLHELMTDDWRMAGDNTNPSVRSHSIHITFRW